MSSQIQFYYLERIILILIINGIYYELSYSILQLRY